jgi:hypothetical protein
MKLLKTIHNNHVPILLALCLLLIFTINYGFYHSTYKYPLHADDWIHVVVTDQITLGRTVNEKDPYFHTDLMFYPRGFHVLLAELAKLTGLDMLQIARFFPGIFQCIIALMFFLLLNRFFGTGAGLFGAFSVAVFRTHPTILGPAYLVPLNFGLLLTPLMLYFLLRGYKTAKTKYFILGFFIWFVIFNFHFSSFLFASFIALLSMTELFFAKQKIETFQSIVISAAVFIIAIFFFLSSFYKTSMIKSIIGLIQGTGSIMLSPFSPIFLVNYMLAFFAFIGLYYLFSHRKTGSATIIAWIVFIFINLFLFYKMSGLGFSYERSVFYATEVLVITGAIGLAYATKYFHDYPKTLKYIPIIIFIFILGISFYSNATSASQYMYYLIDDSDYKAYTWLGERYPNHVLLDNHLKSLSLPYFHIRPAQISPMHAVPVGYWEKFGVDYMHMNAKELKQKMKNYGVDFVRGTPSEGFELIYNKAGGISRPK